MQSINDAARKCSVFAYVPADVASSLAKGGKCRRKKGPSGPSLYALLSETKGRGSAQPWLIPSLSASYFHFFVLTTPKSRVVRTKKSLRRIAHSSGTVLMRHRHTVAQSPRSEREGWPQSFRAAIKRINEARQIMWCSDNYKTEM